MHTQQLTSRGVVQSLISFLLRYATELHNVLLICDDSPKCVQEEMKGLLHEVDLTCKVNGLHLCTHKSSHQRVERSLKVNQYKARVANNCRYGNPHRHATHSLKRLKLPSFAEDCSKHCCKLGWGGNVLVN